MEICIQKATSLPSCLPMVQLSTWRWRSRMVEKQSWGWSQPVQGLHAGYCGSGMVTLGTWLPLLGGGTTGKSGTAQW